MKRLILIPILLSCAFAHPASLSLSACNIADLAAPARCGTLDVPEHPLT
jgi:hypothetical protein